MIGRFVLNIRVLKPIIIRRLSEACKQPAIYIRLSLSVYSESHPPSGALRRAGCNAQSMSLLICVLVGFIVGVGGVNFIEEDTWPTYEMESRGNPWGLLTGIVITIPSGMAVALSILRFEPTFLSLSIPLARTVAVVRTSS